ncbi:MAG TPA: regulatory protein RecX [Salinivirgaceae bacterium]|nr:regulatory protein RecX [Salinivirgaceae bacterium]
MSENDFQKYLNKAMKYCAYKEKCEYDVRTKLEEWGAKDEMHDVIIDYLTANKFVDNQRYTSAYVNDAVKLKLWGRIKIRAMLKMKNIPDWIINQALREIDETEYCKALTKLLQTKIKSDTLSDIEKQKVIKSMYSRGYEPEIVFEIIDGLESN